MDILIFSANVVLPLFLMMLLGYFFRRFNFYDDVFLKKANSVNFRLFMPFMMFYNVYSSNFMDEFNPRFLIFGIMSLLLVVLVLCIIVPRFEKDSRRTGVMIQCLFRSNVVLYGLPMCINLFGSEGIGSISILLAFFAPMLNFFSAVILEVYASKTQQRKINVVQLMKDIIKNPLIYSSIIGVIFAVLNIRLPNVMEKVVLDISKVSTPLALIFLGGEFKFTTLSQYKKHIVIVSTFRLIIIPAIIIYIAVVLGFRGYELGAIFVCHASPVAVASFVMSQEADADAELAGLAIAITTMLSCFTVFVFVYVMKYLQLI